MLLRIVLLILIVSALLFIIHVGLKRFSGDNLPLPILFIAILALNQTLALPFILFNGSFRWFVGCFVGLFIFLAFILRHSIQNEAKQALKYLASFRPYTKKTQLVICSIILVLLSFATMYQRLDIDDSYYLGLSAEAVASDTLNNHDPSTGNPEYPVFPFYKLQAYELLIALLTFLTGLPVSITAHIGIPIFVIPLIILSIKMLVKYFYVDEKLSTLGTALFALAILFSGKSAYLLGNFILARSWQGKAILIGLCVPLYLYYSLLLVSRNKPLYSFILLCIYWAAFSLNPIAVFIFPPILLISLITEVKLIKIKEQIRLLIPSILLFLVSALALKVAVSDFKPSLEGSFWFAEIDLSTYWTIIQDFYGSWKVLLLFAIQVLIGLVIGNKKYRRFLIALISVWIIILNPFFANIVAQNITSSSTYWRLFWLTMPELILSLTITAVTAKLIGIKYFRKYLFPVTISSALVFMVYSGDFMFSQNNGFTLTNNLHKVPDHVVVEAHTIPKHSKVLGNLISSSYIRSINPDIEVAYSRKHYMDYILVNDIEKLKQLEQAVSMIEHEELTKNLCALHSIRDVDYFIYKSGVLLGNNCY